MGEPANDPDFAILTSLRYDETLVDTPETPGQRGCPLYMPELHHQRLLTSWHYFGSDSNTSGDRQAWQGTTEEFVTWILDEVEKRQKEDVELAGKPLKIRLAITRSGTSSLTFNPIPPIPLNNLYPTSLDSLLAPPDTNTKTEIDSVPHTTTTLHLDTRPSTPPSHNAHKSTHRDIYSTARDRLAISDTVTDVLLFNPNGEVMETSISTVYMKLRDGRWVTPSMASGCQRGTTRRWALEGGLCGEGVVMVDELEVREGRGKEKVKGVVVSNGVRGFGRARVVWD